MFVAILQEKENLKISLLLALIGLRRPRPRTLSHFLKISFPSWSSSSIFFPQIEFRLKKETLEELHVFQKCLHTPRWGWFWNCEFYSLIHRSRNKFWVPLGHFFVFFLEGSSSREKIITRCESIEFGCSSWNVKMLDFLNFSLETIQMKQRLRRLRKYFFIFMIYES